MGLLDRLNAAWSVLRAPGPASAIGPTGGPMTSDAWLFGRGPTPSRLVEGYRQAVYACAEINAVTVSAVPLRLYATTHRGAARPRSYCEPRPVDRRTRGHLADLPYVARALAAAESVDEVTAHPILDLLDDPNPEFDRPSLLGYLSSCLDVIGTAYLRPEGLAGLPPAHLWPLPPQDVSPVRSGRSAIPEQYTYGGSLIPAAELIRIRLIGLKDPYGPGYPPAQAAFAYAGLEEVWTTTRDQLLRAGPKPSALVSPSDPKMGWGPDESRRLQVDLNRKVGGPNSGGIVVAGTGAHYQTISHKPTDLDGAIGREALQNIANCFGVPIAFLTGETNLANLQAAELQHGRRAVGPRCTRIAAVLTKWVKQFDARLFFAFDDCCPEDEERRSRLHERYVRAKVLTVDDVRGEIGWEPVPWGAEPWIPSTERQPSEERPAPSPPPGADPKADDPKADDPKADDPKAKPKSDADDDTASKALEREALALIRSVKQRLDADAHDDDDDDDDELDGPDDYDDGDGPGGEPAAVDPGEAEEGAEHLPPADGAGDRQDAQAVVRDPGPGDPGDGADARGGAADGPAGADGL